jgi:hypothetical protein
MKPEYMFFRFPNEILNSEVNSKDRESYSYRCVLETNNNHGEMPLQMVSIKNGYVIHVA